MNRQGVCLTVSDRQFYDLLNDAAGNGGIVDGIDVPRLLVQIVIEVDADGGTAIYGYFILQSAFIEEVECGFRDDVYLSRLAIGAFEAVGQGGVVGARRVGHEGNAAQCASHVGDDGPLCLVAVLACPGVFCLYADIAVGGTERRSLCGLWHLDETRTYIGREGIVPFRIADVLLCHHTVPFATSHLLVVLQAKQ